MRRLHCPKTRKQGPYCTVFRYRHRLRITDQQLCHGPRAGDQLTDSTHKAEEYDLSNSHNPNSFVEFKWVPHLSNKAGQCNLPDECVADVEKSVHAGDKSSPYKWDSQNLGRAAWDKNTFCVVMTWSWGVSIRMIFGSSEDGGQQDTKECEEGGNSAGFG